MKKSRSRTIIKMPSMNGCLFREKKGKNVSYDKQGQVIANT